MGKKKLSKEEFVKRAKAVHGDKYDYNNIDYKDYNKTKICIICHEKDEDGNEHWEFWQLPEAHARGQGCPRCSSRAKLTTEEFIRKARLKHCDTYNYDKTVVNGNNKSYVTITCPIHGDFRQKINNHLNGQGCYKCGKERMAKQQTLTKDEFIRKARIKHGDKYNYSEVVIAERNDTKVCIICKKHGRFWQFTSSHISGSGCPWCNQSHLENETMRQLERNNVVFKSQKTFPWLKNKREMPLDFYLPEYNIAIECQGVQHYLAESNGYFKTEDIKSTQQNDKLKHQLCKSHGIHIHYIKYNENVEENINTLLKQLNQ